MIKYVLGVDGGGTKTHCALFSQDGNLLDFVEWNTTSHEFLPGGYDELEIELGKMLGTIIQRNKMSWDDVQAVFGLAGVDSQKQQKIIADFIGKIGLRNSSVQNDSYLGIKCGAEKGWGVCSFSGSGTGASGIDPKGNANVIGALFELSGDYAGGRVLGAEVVNHSYDMLFRFGRETILAELLINKMGVETKQELMEAIVCGCSDHSLEVKELAPLLFEAAKVNDEVAVDILKKSGNKSAKDIIAVIKTLDFPIRETLPIVLLGSLYTRCACDIHIKTMKEAVEREFPNRTFKYETLSTPPVVGAVYWAMENAGLEIDRQKIANQINQKHCKL